MIKDFILEFLDAHMGKVLLGVALLWGGACIFFNRYEALPAELTDAPERSLYVELDHLALSKASTETYYAAGPAVTADSFALKRLLFTTEVIVKQFSPVDLDTPPLSVKRPPQLLPEPGPSLEGADKLPRFGEEFPPPSASDLPPPPKGAQVGAGNPINK